jgi:hypothetical protein
MKKYLIRTKILEVLRAHEYRFNQVEENQYLPYYELEASIGVNQIAELTGFSEEELDAQLTFLANHNEVKVISDHPNVFYILSREGHVACADEKYVKQARDERTDILTKRVGIYVAIGTLLLTAFGMWLNYNHTTEKTEQIQYQIDSLQTQIEKSTR